jgi:hypothetical protein
MKIPAKFRSVSTMSELQALVRKSGAYDVSSVFDLDEASKEAIAVVCCVGANGEMDQFELRVRKA